MASVLRQYRGFSSEGFWSVAPSIGIRKLTGIRLDVQISQFNRHTNDILRLLTHADDSAAAQFHPSVSDCRQRFDPVIIRMSGADFAVVRRAGVHVVVYAVDTTFL